MSMDPDMFYQKKSSKKFHGKTDVMEFFIG